MSAPRSTFAQPAMFAGHTSAKCMPFSMHHMCMQTAPNMVIIETGVLASVSLFALLHIVYALLLVSLVLLISLILIGLTGFGGLVGLLEGLESRSAQGRLMGAM